MKIGKYNITGRNLILLFSAIAILINLYSLAWLPLEPYLHRGLLVSVFIILTVLLNPPKSKIGQILLSVLTLAALFGSVYVIIFADKLCAQFHFASDVDAYTFIIFLVGFMAVLTRVRGGGIVVGGLLGLGLAYLVWGQHLSGLFSHGPLPLNYIATLLYTDINVGAFGFYTEIIIRVVSIFMIFAALLMATGLGELFTALACWLAGGATGGPAKVAIFSSGLFGMLSGTSVANVAATGSFTIPLMKRIGYKPSVAASIEAIASTGGNIMPPVMGIAAFLMAEILGIPYLRICLAAIIPVFTWYFTCFLTVHFYALRTGIKKWRPPKEEFTRVVKGKIHLVLAIVALVGALIYFPAAEYAGFAAVVVLLIIANARKETRLTKARITDFLERYARMFGPLFILVVGIAMFVSAIMGVSAHIKLGYLLLEGVEQWYLMALIAACFITVLGSVLPLSASYLAGVAVLAPVLILAGYDPLVIHFFVFYVAALAPITPPVAAATFTAATIAGSNMMKTGIEATIRALPLWIIPFIIFRKALLLGVGTPLSVIGVEVAFLCLGVFVFVLGAEGYSSRRLGIFERILAAGTGLMIVQPLSDFLTQIFAVIGILLVAFWWVPDFLEKRKAKKAQVY